MGFELQEICSELNQAVGVYGSDSRLGPGQGLQFDCCCPSCGLHFCMQVLGFMMSTFETVLYAQFRTRVLQKDILSKWNRFPAFLDNQICLG